MAENKEYITRQESMGTIQISEDVVASISSSVAPVSYTHLTLPTIA